jgi:hypothetical protein
MYHRLKNHFGHLIELLGDVAYLESRFGTFGDAFSVVQDSCTVCAECTTGSEIILDAPSGTPKRRGSSRRSFRSV